MASPDAVSQSASDSAQLGFYEQAVRWLLGYDVFVSYKRGEGDQIANSLCAKLRAREYTVFRDRQEGLHGDHLKDRISRELKRSRALLLAATEGAFLSEHVLFEVDTFLKLHKGRRPCVPVGTRQCRDGCPKPAIRERVWVEPSTPEFDNSVPDEVIDEVVTKLEFTKRSILFRNWLFAATLAFLVIATAAGIAAWKAQVNFERAVGLQLAAEAELIRARDVSLLPRAVLMAATSLRRSPNPQAAETLYASTVLLPQRVRAIAEYPEAPVHISSDGDVIEYSDAPSSRVITIVSTGKRQKLDLGAAITFSALSEDGRTVVLAGIDQVKAFDAHTGSPRGRFALESAPKALRIAPGGTAVAISTPTSLLVLKLPDIEEVCNRPIPAKSFAWDPSGSMLAIAGEDERHRPSLALLSIRGCRINAQTPLESAARAGAWSANGDLVTTIDEPSSGSVQIWRLPDLSHVAKLHHDAAITDVAFSRDGSFLASGATDRKLRLWAAPFARQQPVAVLSNDESIASVAFDPDSSRVLTVSDRSIRIWDAGHPRQIGERDLRVVLPVPPRSVAAFAQDGSAITVASPGNLNLWNVGPMNTLTQSRGNAATGVSHAFSFDGRWILLTGGQGFQIWDAVQARGIGAIPSYFGRFWAGAISGDGRFAAEVENRRETVRREDRPNGPAVAYLRWSSHPTVHLWQTQPLKELPPLKHEHEVLTAALDATGANLALGCEQRAAHVFNLKTGGRKDVTVRGPAHGVALSGSGETLAVAGPAEDRRSWLTIYERAGDAVTTVELPAAVLRLSVRKDGRLVGVGLADGTARIWSVRSRRFDAELRHPAEVLDISFSDDPDVILTGDRDGNARVWNLPRTEEISRIRLGHPVTNVSAITARQAFAFVSGSELRTWPMDPEQMVQEACSHITRRQIADLWSQYTDSVFRAEVAKSCDGPQ